MNLNELAAEIHEYTKSQGFWPKAHNCHHKEEHTCSAGICDFAGRDPIHVLALIASEAFEAMDEIRNGHEPWELRESWLSSPGHSTPDIELYDGKVYISGTKIEATRKFAAEWGFIPKPEGVPSELADVIIRVLDACAAWGINIEQVIADKMAYNRTRPFKHGRKF